MRSKVMWGTILLFSATTFAACQPSQPVGAVAKEPEELKLDVQEPAPAPQPLTVKALQPKKPVAKDATPSAAQKTLVAKQSAKTAEAKPVLTTAPVTASNSVAATQGGEDSIATTISGCLVRDDGMFQLRDTDGEHAPKSRSWKSGFIKKGSAKVDLIDATNRLSPHVGYRISVSGTLTDREMQVRSVRGTTERCD